MWTWLFVGLALAAPGDPPPLAFGPDRSADAPLDEASVLRVIESIDPEQHRRLLRLKTRDPVLYQRLLQRARGRIERNANDPEALRRGMAMRQLNAQLKALREDYRTASGNRRVELRQQMVRQGLALFELRQEERRARLRDLRRKLDNLQSEVDQREANKDRLVDEYIDGLLGDSPR